MRGSIRGRLTYANVMSSLAVFLTLGTGTAYATHLVVNSSDVVDETLVSADLKNGYAVKASDVVSNSLTGASINEGTLGEVPRAKIGGLGRSATDSDGWCDPVPQTETPTPCAVVAVRLPTPARLLLIGETRATLEGSNWGSGACYLGTSATGALTETRTEVELGYGGGAGEENLSISTVTSVFPAGEHLFGIDCADYLWNGPMRYQGSRITAVAISPS